MKKTFVQTVAFFLLMASCSKTPTTSPDGDKGNQPYLLSFTIDGFSQELLPFPDNKLAAVQRSPAQPLQANAVTSTTDIRDFINVLEIKVYDERCWIAPVNMRIIPNLERIKNTLRQCLNRDKMVITFISLVRCLKTMKI